MFKGMNCAKQGLFILSKEDFEIVVDFLFYSAMACYQDLLQREILGKYRCNML